MSNDINKDFLVAMSSDETGWWGQMSSGKTYALKGKWAFKKTAFPITQKMKFSIKDFLSKCDWNSQKIADLVTFSEMFNS